MYLNTRIFPTTGYARVLLFMFIRRELDGTSTGCLFQFTYCAYDMFNRYHHAYQINQEKVQKSLFKSLFIVMKFQTPSPFYPPYLSSA